MNFGRKGTYESIEESEVMQNKYDSQYGSDVDQSSNIKEKILKYSIIFLFGLAIILIIIMILYKGKKQNFNVKQNINISQQPISDKITNEKENNDIVVNTNNKFSDIFPKTCIKDLCNNISNLNELFESRRLFIDDNNITNEYIRFIRPINETEEESYKKKLYPNLTLDNYHKSTKEGKISVIDFYQICNKPEIINSNITEAPYNPAISVIIPSYNKKNNLTLTLNSVIIQTLKNIEIIIVDDGSDDGSENIFELLYEKDCRIRLFKHKRNMGVWRTRLDGFLYSRGKYVLHIDPDDFLSDYYILEEILNLTTKYNLDSVRFTFSKVPYQEDLINSTKLGVKYTYPQKFTKIIYGKPGYNVHFFGYGTIWNRLIRANVISKGLNYVDEYILNAYKNLWDDMWWNSLVNKVSFSNVIVNRLGYIFVSRKNGVGRPDIKDSIKKDKTIREFIYFWFFDYQLLPKENNKKIIIKKLIKYNQKDNTFYGLPINLDYLSSNFFIYDRLLHLLINDTQVQEDDKKIVQELLNNSTKIN